MDQMLPEKRIRSQPKPYPVFNVRSSRKDKYLEKKRKLSSIVYEIIPLPSKYDFNTDALLLYGNIALLQKNNDFFTDFSLLNQFHVYSDIQVKKYHNQRLVSIKVERRIEARFPRWKNVAKKMIKAKDPNAKRWGKAIKSFSVSYEAMMTEYWNKVGKMVLEYNYKEKVEALQAATEERRRELHAHYPCLQFKTHFRGYENHLTEVVLNEKFLQMVGYTPEAFASVVLSEGLPEFIPLNLETNSQFIQNTLENCLKKETNDDFQPLEIEAIVLTKSGYVKPVKIQVHILMTHENTEYGSFTIFVITDQGQAYPRPKDEEIMGSVNPSFMNVMLARKQEATDFLSSYYSHTGSLLYTNLHRVCKIKELEISSPV